MRKNALAYLIKKPKTSLKETTCLDTNAQAYFGSVSFANIFQAIKTFVGKNTLAYFARQTDLLAFKSFLGTNTPAYSAYWNIR